MSRNSIFRKLLSILEDSYGMDIGEVTLEMSYEDMGHDSLSAIEFLIACEDTFDITVPDNIATGFHTLEDLVEYIYDNY